MVGRGAAVRKATATWLALLALVVQALVVAPHVHPLAPADLPTHHWTAPAATQVAPPARNDPTDEPFVPADQCPLCQALSLAGRAIPVAPAALAPPQVRTVAIAVPAAVAIVRCVAAPVGARAPPAIV